MERPKSKRLWDRFRRLGALAHTDSGCWDVPAWGRATEIALDSLPQVVMPATPYYLKQLVYMKFDCPTKPTRRQFCTAALAAIDEALGTSYLVLFAKSKSNADDLVLRLQHLMVLHAVGIMIVDEVQNVLKSPEGSQAFLDFFVGLVNRLSIPVMLIGTMEAGALAQGAFRQARRSAGLGQPNWSPLRPGEEWDDWLEQMWSYQWTNVVNPLTPSISKVIFEESQGIIDIAVKLLLVAQFRVISRGQVSPETPEILDEKVFRTVAREDFALVQPLLRALRDDRVDLLVTVPDLMPFTKHVDHLLSSQMSMTAMDFRVEREALRRTRELERESRLHPTAPWITSIIKKGFSETIAGKVVNEAFARHDADDVMSISSTIAGLLMGQKASGKKSGGSGKRIVTDENVLKEVVASSENPLDGLRAAGVVADLDDLVRA